MRTLILAAAALLVAGAPAAAADPPVVFQVQPVGRVLDELRAAARLVGGDKAVTAFNKAVKQGFGEKGLEGLDIGRPVVGYVVLAPKPADITAVVALPVTGEKEFLDLCDRVNKEKIKPDAKDKTLYHLPPADPRYKAVMRFSDQYAYIAYGANPLPHIDPKALVPMPKLYDPADRGLVSARVYFDRIPADVRKAAPALVEEMKKTLFGGGGPAFFGFGRAEAVVLKPVLEGFNKFLDRCAKLSEGADVLAARVYFDPQASTVVVEATLSGKPDTELAKVIAARKPTANRFAAVAKHPDTAAAFALRAPLLEMDEVRGAAASALEALRKEAVQGAKEAGKAAADELLKGLIRTVKTGELDGVIAVRGPDKGGDFTLVGALAFEDATALGKEFRKFAEKDAPQDVLDAIKWDAAKVGGVGIHTWTMKDGVSTNFGKVFGGDHAVLAFAFAPHGILAAMGPDAVNVLKDMLAAKPGPAPLVDVALNPARVRKFVAKIAPNDPETGRIIEFFGKEDKLGSVLSLTADGGKELTVRLTTDLRALPRFVLMWFTASSAPEPAVEIEKK